MDWPKDLDGDVFRRMAKDGFDFERPVDIEFNIDFDIWPLPAKTINYLKNKYPDGELIDPDEEDLEAGIKEGYFRFIVHKKVSYELVTNMQRRVSEEMAAHKGYCDSWGVPIDQSQGK